jgi:hypothetical protein
MAIERGATPVDTIEKVIGLEELEQATVAGWEVVARFDTDEPVSTTRQHIPEPQPGNNYYAPPPTTLCESAVGRVAKFHVRLDSASTLARLNGELSALKTELRTAKSELETSAKETKRLKEEHGRLESQHRNAAEDAKRFREEAGRTRDEKAKLEADLGKIREAIGRKAFEEILPPKKKDTAGTAAI